MHDKVRKVKEEGSLRESEKKSQACCVFQTPNLEKLLNSAHAQTSNFASSSDDHKVYTKYTVSKQLFGKT